MNLLTLTRFMKTLGEDLGRAGMAEGAGDIARGMKLAGVETWGDMRLIDKQTLVENGGLRPLDALKFSREFRQVPPTWAGCYGDA